MFDQFLSKNSRNKQWIQHLTIIALTGIGHIRKLSPKDRNGYNNNNGFGYLGDH